ncbi:MAG TPA: DUF192 domain-containing protein, partial [Methylocystis sp.]
MRSAQRFRLLIWSLFLALALTVARAEPALETLGIVTATGEHDFKVEVVDTPKARARGLMFRKSMPADHGM